MVDNPLRVSFAGLDLDYATFTQVDDLFSTLLWGADRQGLLEYFGATSDGYFLVVVRGKPRLLHVDEVHGFVIGLVDLAGLDITPFSYRTGLATSRVAGPAVDGSSDA